MDLQYYSMLINSQDYNFNLIHSSEIEQRGKCNNSWELADLLIQYK